jgi:GNAT superfamily N-acetyltransferase
LDARKSVGIDLNNYELIEGLERIDFERVREWLSNLWWPGVRREAVERSARGSSLVIGVYERSTRKQVAYTRVISDMTTFAWLCDVVVDEAHRGRGIGRAMVRYALAHPEHQGLRRWMLSTGDAHRVYAACGFEPYPDPSRIMSYVPRKVLGE